MVDVAVIKDGVVVNIALFDSADTIAGFDFTVSAGKGAFGVEIPEDQNVSMGYGYKDGKFTAPEPTDEEVAAQEAAEISANVGAKASLMEEASQRISVLQDAVDLEMATDEETAALPLWKKYRVLLNRVDANTPDAIEWPEKPS